MPDDKSRPSARYRQCEGHRGQRDWKQPGPVGKQRYCSGGNDAAQQETEEQLRPIFSVYSLSADIKESRSDNKSINARTHWLDYPSSLRLKSRPVWPSEAKHTDKPSRILPINHGNAGGQSVRIARRFSKDAEGQNRGKQDKLHQEKEPRERHAAPTRSPGYQPNGRKCENEDGEIASSCARLVGPPRTIAAAAITKLPVMWAVKILPRV